MAKRRRKSSSSSINNDTSEIVTVRRKSIQKSKDLMLKVKPENRALILFQISLVLSSIIFFFYTYYWFDHFHFHVTSFYANKIDNHHAQHVLGHKLLKNQSYPEAFTMFRKSADRGHPHSAYNLAVGHLSGYRTDVQKGEVRQLLKFAAKNGVDEARKLLIGLCREKPKYCDL